jgi:hypothetical protein
VVAVTASALQIPEPLGLVAAVTAAQTRVGLERLGKEITVVLVAAAVLVALGAAAQQALDQHLPQPRIQVALVV